MVHGQQVNAPYEKIGNFGNVDLACIWDALGGSPLLFRSTIAIVDAGVNVTRKTAQVKGWNILNTTGVIIYVKIYDKGGAIDPATETPILTIPVPANGSVFLPVGTSQRNTINGIQIRVTTGIADTDVTPPATPPIIELNYSI
jgi:hypothetical protein